MKYFNPGGRDFGSFNVDGYAMSYIAFAVVYSMLFYLASAYVWYHRNIPVLKMRKLGLSLLSVQVLHIYLIAVLLLYPLNGCFPCSAEYWVMSIYLPLGTGLFQAQNQQLLLVSRKQNRMLRTEEFKPMYRGHNKSTGTGTGTPRYWFWRVKLWWQGVSTQGKYEGFVFVGMIVQVAVSIFIYCISRQFSSFGIVSHYKPPGQCRGGWEWAPSIIWQFLWNYIFGPYLLWKIRVIHDIYHWRLQTTLTIIAGLPGAPLWVAAVYSHSFKSVNKWLAPAIWFVPGLLMMEITIMFFSVLNIFRKKRHDKAVRRNIEELAVYTDQRRRDNLEALTTSSQHSLQSTISNISLYSLEALNKCIRTDHQDLLNFAASREFNGENIIFLAKVIQFQKQWQDVFLRSSEYGGYSGALDNMFRVGLGIYIYLVNPSTAPFPINIESAVMTDLKSMFGTAAALVASEPGASQKKTSVSAEIAPWEHMEPSSQIAPWNFQYPPGSSDLNNDLLPMLPVSRSTAAGSISSTNQILRLLDRQNFIDALAKFIVPVDFDETVFNVAYKSIAHMVWTGTWKNYVREQELKAGTDGQRASSSSANA